MFSITEKTTTLGITKTGTNNTKSTTKVSHISGLGQWQDDPHYPNNLTTTSTNSATFHSETIKNFAEQLNQMEYAKS